VSDENVREHIDRALETAVALGVDFDCLAVGTVAHINEWIRRLHATRTVAEEDEE
jgi:hypothetical protein